METVRASDYHEVAQVEDPRVSPDGERVAFVRKVPTADDEYERTVHVVPVGGDEPRQFTVAEGVDSRPRWSPSGDRLAFVSTRGADDDRPQLWVMPTDGGEARQVTDVGGGVSGVAWSPDGRRIAFVQRATEDDREAGRDLGLDGEEFEPEDPDPRVIDRMVYRTGERYFDGKRSHVYVADLTTDDEVTRLTDGDYDHLEPEWGDATTLYYGVRRTGDPDDNIVIDVAEYDLDVGEEAGTVVQTTGWTPMLAVTSGGDSRSGEPRSSDGSESHRLAYARTPEENATLRQTEIEVLDRGTGEVTTPTESLDRTLSLDVSVQWGPDGEDLYFLTPDEGDYALWRAPGDASADPERVVGDGEVEAASVGEDKVAFVRSEWDHPGDVFVSTLGGAETRRVTRVNREYLDERAVCQPEEIRFENDSGDEIQGWVLTPPDFDPSEEYPLAVEIHGGPHSMWTTSGSMWQEFQLLAARGYVVFWSNPRGSTGYGEEFMAAIEGGQWGPPAYEDIMTGVDEVAGREYVDEGNMFVTGGSYGGYMTTWVVGHTDRFAGAVSQRGVYELNSFYGSSDAFKLVEWDFDATPWEDAEFLWEQSPAAYADEVDTPTLLVHAENDFRVPVNNGEMLYLMYKKNDVETRLVRYPREGHELSRSGEPGHVVDRLERIVRWFDGYSDHHDAPKALARGDEGLSAGEDDENGEDSAGGAETDDQ